MRRLMFENSRGEQIEFYLSPLLIESLEGISEVDADVQGQESPYQDGDTYIDTRLQPRFIDLEGAITKTSLKDIKEIRRHVLRVCNPKLGLGKITLELDGDTKEITGVLDGSPVFPERRRDVFQKFTVNWKCPDPYWQDPNQVSRALRAYEGKFTLPFTLPFRLGKQGDRTTLVNEGDVPAPVQIDLQGPVTNPKITNETTGEFMQINGSIAADEVLHIDTSPGHKRIEVYNGNNFVRSVFGRLAYEAGASFWQLEIGENDVSYVADEGNSKAIVAVSWKNRYSGI